MSPEKRKPNFLYHLLAPCTDQVSMEKSPNLQNYLNRCSEVIPDYHQILTDLKASPKIIREIKAKLKV